jgi:hypothetical protein
MTQDLMAAKNAALEMAEQQCRQMMRLVAPVVDRMPELYPNLVKASDNVGIKHCRVCNPPPQLFKCQLCDWETEDRWRMATHVDLRPKWCLDRAKKKETVWASKS